MSREFDSPCPHKGQGLKTIGQSVDNSGDSVHKRQTFRQVIGQKGEDLACLFLKRHGFTIVDRNYLKKFGEIDIVARKGNDWRFVEVKTVSRSGGGGGVDDYEPEDNVHPWKLKRLARTIEIYLSQKGIGDDVDWQIDVLAVYLDQAGREIKIDWLESVF
ncbi:MAG: YraN family protein [Patescibacteria group bacterium]